MVFLPESQPPLNAFSPSSAKKQSQLDKKVTNALRKRQSNSIPEAKNTMQKGVYTEKLSEADKSTAAVRKRTLKGQNPSKKKSAIQENSLPINVQTVQQRASDIKSCLTLSELFQSNLDLKEQNAFCLAIASKLQDVIENPAMHGQEHYFKKYTTVTAYTETGPQQIKLSWTFYVMVSHDMKEARIECNIPDSAIEEGGYKRISKGYTFTIALHAPAQTSSAEQARARPVTLDQPLLMQKAVDSINIQQQVKQRMVDENRIVYITDPARLRTHQTQLDETRIEMIMPLYRGDLMQVGPRSLDVKIAELADLFSTINNLAESGITHCDVKPENVLLDASHAYLHDFDLVKMDQPLGQAGTPSCADSASQFRIVTHVTDVVGAIITACFVIFDVVVDSPQVLKSGVENAFMTLIVPSLEEKYKKLSLELAQPVTSEAVLKQLADKSPEFDDLYNDLSYKLQVLSLFCDAMSKEDEYTKAIIGSCICYFSNKSASEYSALMQTDREKLQNDLEEGVKKWAVEQYDSTLISKLSKNEPLSTSELLFHKEIMSLATALSQLLDNAEMAGLLPDNADPHIFSGLMSGDPTRQMNARQDCFALFPTAQVLLDKLMQIPMPMMH